MLRHKNKERAFLIIIPLIGMSENTLIDLALTKELSNKR